MGQNLGKHKSSNIEGANLRILLRSAPSLYCVFFAYLNKIFKCAPSNTVLSQTAMCPPPKGGRGGHFKGRRNGGGGDPVEQESVLPLQFLVLLRGLDILLQPRQFEL